MKIFVDTSVILASLGSTIGGSSAVLKLSYSKRLKAVISQAVLEEILRNAFKVNHTQEDVEKVITQNLIEVTPAPSSKQVDKYLELVGAKDAHVVASAVGLEVDVLVTLDRKHLLKEGTKKLLLPLAVMSPAELLQKLIER